MIFRGQATSTPQKTIEPTLLPEGLLPEGLLPECLLAEGLLPEGLLKVAKLLDNEPEPCSRSSIPVQFSLGGYDRRTRFQYP